jgi:hypothetical protein
VWLASTHQLRVCVCVHAPIVLTGGTPCHSPFSVYVVLLAPLPLSRARPSCLPPYNALGLDKTIIGGLYVPATRVLLLCTVSAACSTHYPSRCTSLALYFVRTNSRVTRPLPSRAHALRLTSSDSEAESEDESHTGSMLSLDTVSSIDDNANSFDGRGTTAGAAGTEGTSPRPPFERTVSPLGSPLARAVSSDPAKDGGVGGDGVGVGVGVSTSLSLSSTGRVGVSASSLSSGRSCTPSPPPTVPKRRIRKTSSQSRKLGEGGAGGGGQGPLHQSSLGNYSHKDGESPSISRRSSSSNPFIDLDDLDDLPAGAHERSTSPLSVFTFISPVLSLVFHEQRHFLC